MTNKPLIIGNWKLHGSQELCRALTQVITPDMAAHIDVVLAPPVLFLPTLSASMPSGVMLGSQDISFNEKGAFTGEISATMLREVGVTYAIIGHSERRQYHNETDGHVTAKASAAQRAGLVPVICVGETEGEREYGQLKSVLERQVSRAVADLDKAELVVVAYEPVWAIGSGSVPSADDIQEATSIIQDTLLAAGVSLDHQKILYGGSVNAGNIAEILAVQGVQGCLVGGASIVPEKFEELLQQC